MDSSRDTLNGKAIVCLMCDKTFSTTQTRNRHVKKFHNIIEDKRINHIVCPLCESPNELLRTNANLEVHLQEYHGIVMAKASLKFVSKEEYDKWEKAEKIGVNYGKHRTKKTSCYTETHYACNRSNRIGYEKKYEVRTEKAAGSIKISGICPSRYVIKFFANGEIIANIQRTHVGHVEELGSQHLSSEEKNVIVEKLRVGVTIDRILEDARSSCSTQLSRMNLLSRKDVNYLFRKYNIDKRRHVDEMTAVMLKVEEWNANGKNHAFLFKQLELTPTYLMTDDDPKYFNAWVKVMGNQPRRLLCTWHVIKNWNVQGRAKIKYVEMKKNMKKEMKRILNEVDEDRFQNLYQEYFKKLQDADETDFLNYLKK